MCDKGQQNLILCRQCKLTVLGKIYKIQTASGSSYGLYSGSMLDTIILYLLGNPLMSWHLKALLLLQPSVVFGIETAALVSILLSFEERFIFAEVINLTSTTNLYFHYFLKSYYQQKSCSDWIKMNRVRKKDVRR